MPSNREALVAELALEILDSFEKLDLVVLLERAGAVVPIATLRTQVGPEPEDVAEAVEALVADGVLVRSRDGVALAASGRWAPHVAALAALYREDRIHVVTAMSQAAVRRLRSKAERAFAEAFVIRSKKGDADG